MKFYYFLLAIILFTACSSADQKQEQQATPSPEVKNPPKKMETKIEALTVLPKGMSMLGQEFLTGRTWTDANGENIVLASLAKTVRPHDPDGYDVDFLSKHLYVEHLVRKTADEAYTRIRKIEDFEKDCQADNMLAFNEESLQITDLDKDNYKEISFVYTLGCRSDVSPDPMKLMLLENGEKYAIRGNTRSEHILRYELGEDAVLPESKDKKFDASFDKAPPTFKKFANDLWNKYELKR